MSVIVQSLLLAASLFAIGLVGFVTRRNMILMFLAVELMLAGVALNLVAFGASHGNDRGQIFAILVVTLASCEAAIGLAVVVALFRRKSSLDIQLWSSLRSPAALDSRDYEPLPAGLTDDGESDDKPRLTPAGLDPLQKTNSARPATPPPAYRFQD
jgi:NADH-quinone oxidoreductase subunit K